MAKNRKCYTPEQKVVVLKKHLLEGIAVSDLCDQHELDPSMFYRWQKDLFTKGHLAFQNGVNRRKTKLEKRVEELESKLSKKNEVLSELMEEHMSLKKSLGEIESTLGAA